MLSARDLELLDAYEKGEHHQPGSADTPLREDAFAMDDDLKMELISKHFREIMHILGLDLTDDSLRGTPDRVAKMYVKEIFSGLNPATNPRLLSLRINTITTKCWWRKISWFIPIANIILCPS